MNPKTWSDDEVNFLIDKYPKISNQELARLLNRSVESVRQKASKLKINTRMSFYKHDFYTEADAAREIGISSKSLMNMRKLGYIKPIRRKSKTTSVLYKVKDVDKWLRFFQEKRHWREVIRENEVYLKEQGYSLNSLKNWATRFFKSEKVNGKLYISIQDAETFKSLLRDNWRLKVLEERYTFCNTAVHKHFCQGKFPGAFWFGKKVWVPRQEARDFYEKELDVSPKTLI